MAQPTTIDEVVQHMVGSGVRFGSITGDFSLVLVDGTIQIRWNESTMINDWHITVEGNLVTWSTEQHGLALTSIRWI